MTRLHGPGKSGRRGGGFTLIEVLIAVFLLSMILAAVYSAFFVIHDAATTTTGMVVGLQEARATMDLMRREIEAAMDPANRPVEIKDRDLYGKQTSSIFFDTHASALAGGSRVTYTVEERDEGVLTLIKTVAPPGEDTATFSSGMAEVEAVEGVASFLVEARSGEKRVKTWQDDKWPDDIRVTLTIRIHGADVPLVFTARPYVGQAL